MKKLLLALLIAAAPVAATPGPQSITVKVNGLVCDFCARSIEAMMKKRPDVERVHVDLDKGEVHLAVRARSTLDDPTLRRLVTDSGYAVTAIERTAR
jgi:copper chaperone CopZ